MRLESYKEAKKMPEKYLPSLVDAEIECWWSRPFNEYRICDNDSCKAIYSIEDVYWNLSNFWNKNNHNNDFNCKECNETTTYVYEKEKFLNEISEYIKGDVSAILLLSNNDIVRGFWIVSRKTISSLIAVDFNTRPWSYDKTNLLNDLSINIFWKNNASDESVINFNHLFIWEELRKDKYGGIIMQRMLKLIKFYNDVPSVIETKKNSNVYNFMTRMWYQVLTSDKYWYVIMYLSKDKCTFKDIIRNLNKNKSNKNLDLLSSEFHQQCESDRIFYN